MRRSAVQVRSQAPQTTSSEPVQLFLIGFVSCSIARPSRQIRHGPLGGSWSAPPCPHSAAQEGLPALYEINHGNDLPW